MVNIKGINRNNRRKWIYPDLESARRPVPHSDEVPIPVFDHLTELIESSDESISSVDAAVTCSSESEFQGAVATPLRFNQFELNNLVRDLNLSKKTSEVLASRLNEKIFFSLVLTLHFIVEEKKIYCPIFQRKTIWFSAMMLGASTKNGTSRIQSTRMAPFY